jgi:hypothetical protein
MREEFFFKKKNLKKKRNGVTNDEQKKYERGKEWSGEVKTNCQKRTRLIFETHTHSQKAQIH